MDKQLRQARRNALIEVVMRRTGVTWKVAEVELIAEEWVVEDAVLNLLAMQREAA